MLSNRSEPSVQEKIREALRQTPGLQRLIEAFESAPERFEVDAEAAGLEFAPEVLQARSTSRCRMKVFRPREGKERHCAFFYKRSNLEWSEDRFSYGGVEFLPDDIDPAEVSQWIAWLVSSFDPGRRPERLRRAFLYDIPD